MQRHSSGFSLIEILIAVGIVGVTIIMFHAVFSGSVLSENANYAGVARTIAQTKIDTLRASGYDALPASGAFVDSAMTTIPGGSGTITVATYNATTKQVTVRVEWSGHAGAGGAISLDTLITETGGLP